MSVIAHSQFVELVSLSEGRARPPLIVYVNPSVNWSTYGLPCSQLKEEVFYLKGIQTKAILDSLSGYLYYFHTLKLMNFE